MFISTVVHIFEFLLLSLLGIMLYKLFAAYQKWKAQSVSASSKGGDRSGRIMKSAQPQNPDYLSVSKITVTEEHSASEVHKTKQSSVILTDYIGEFFAENKAMNLEPYRASQAEVASVQEISCIRERAASKTEAVLPEQAKPASNDVLDEDEIIQVKPLNFSPVLVSHHPLLTSNADAIDGEKIIPTLREFVEADAYITVASSTNGLKANNIMSDKVVMAMLDEAKLVCAS